MRFGVERENLTICAISTPPGFGGISVIRVSGSLSSKIDKFLPLLHNKQIQSHKAYYSNFISNEGDVIDEVLVTFFLNQKSFTGEDVAEISCHGNPYVCQLIINELLTLGIKIALPGEFTYRAFMNDRLDLIQAESVLSLIESKSFQSARLSINQLKGSLSKKIESLEECITWILAHIEAGIDFSTENLDIVDHQIIQNKLTDVAIELKNLISSFQSGKLITEGIDVALLGSPNAGKSSILNLLLEEDRAIVSDIPGTTRDVISSDLLYKGLRINLLDTAGLRKSDDLVESIGIQKSLNQHKNSHLNVFVIDISVDNLFDGLKHLNSIDSNNSVFVFNKIDKIPSYDLNIIYSSLISNLDNYLSISFENFKERSLFISAIDYNSRINLLEKIYEISSFNPILEGAIVINSRHYDNLRLALEKVEETFVMIQNNIGSEFIALTLRESLLVLMEMLGKHFDDQIMDKVFKEFCIGK